jgi:hypothetical protein
VLRIHFNDTNPLNLGDWKKDKLGEILRRSRTSPFVMALHNFGPRKIVELLAEKGLNGYCEKRTSYTGICELCIDICNNPEAVSMVETIFDDEENKVKLIAGQVYQNTYKYLIRSGFLELPESV